MQAENNETPSQVNPNGQVLKCHKCNTPINENFFFCPICGVKIKEPPFKFSWTRFTGNVLIAILVPPLGLLPGIKHIKMKERNAKLLGILYILLTIIATIFMIWIIADYVKTLNETINQINEIQSYY